MRKAVAPAPANKNEEILATAVRIFKEKGYHATSMQNIADAVGLQKGSLYHYLSSKEDLLFQVFERASGELTQQLKDILAANDPSVIKVRRAIQAHLIQLCNQIDIFSVYLSERRALNTRHYAKVRAEGELQARLIEKIIQQGVASGELATADSKIAAHAILGMCNWLHQWYSPGGRLTPEEIAKIFGDMVVDGLARKK